MLKLGELAQLINGRVMLVDSNLRVDYDSYNVDKGKVFLWENVTRSAKGEQLYSIDRDNDILTTTIPMTDVIESKDSNTANSVKIVGVFLASGNVSYIFDNLKYMISFEIIILLSKLGKI